MALTPEELNHVNQLDDRELLLLTYETALETQREVKEIRPKVKKIERVHDILAIAWMVLLAGAGLLGFKVRHPGSN